MSGKNVPKNRYNAERSRQHARSGQQKKPATRPLTTTAPADTATPVNTAGTGVARTMDAPVAAVQTPAAPAAARTTPATRPGTGSRGRSGTQGRSTRIVSGLHTNWTVVRRDLYRIGLIAGGMIVFMIALSLILPALRII